MTVISEFLVITVLPLGFYAVGGWLIRKLLHAERTCSNPLHRAEAPQVAAARQTALVIYLFGLWVQAAFGLLVKYGAGIVYGWPGFIVSMLITFAWGGVMMRWLNRRTDEIRSVDS